MAFNLESKRNCEIKQKDQVCERAYIDDEEEEETDLFGIPQVFEGN